MIRFNSLICSSTLAACALLGAGVAHAAPASAMQLRYQQERADCMNGVSGQERATCLHEANAALQEARRGNLSSGDLASNSVARCGAMKGQDREECVMRMKAGSTSGSVRDGGMLREYSHPVKAD